MQGNMVWNAGKAVDKNPNNVGSKYMFKPNGAATFINSFTGSKFYI